MNNEKLSTNPAQKQRAHTLPCKDEYVAIELSYPPPGDTNFRRRTYFISISSSLIDFH